MGLTTADIESESCSDQPIIGYVGAWAPWVDCSLVGRLAQTFDHAKLVIIGPELGRKFCLQAKNISYLGLQDHRLLAAHIKRFTVAIIPFLLNPVTLAVNPVKAYEYLGLGIPVVSTNLPECVMMAPHVDVAQTHAQFLAMVAARLRDPGDADQRKRFALQNTWDQRAAEVRQIIEMI